MPRIYQDVDNTLEIKKSRFITYLHRTENEEDAKDFLKYIRKKHPDATHHCTAIICDHQVRNSDDGEPAGTAGRPMLDVLLHENMDHITAVVVRYFGGTLLGKGGLVRAYSSSVQEALKKARMMEVQQMVQYRIVYGYEWTGKMDAFFQKSRLEREEPIYSDQISCVFYAGKEQDVSAELARISSGRLVPEKLGIVEMEGEIMR